MWLFPKTHILPYIIFLSFNTLQTFCNIPFEFFQIGNTNYTSHRIIDEMLEIIGAVVEEPILSDIRGSLAIGLEIDESTDVSTCRQLDLHVRQVW